MDLCRQIIRKDGAAAAQAQQARDLEGEGSKVVRRPRRERRKPRLGGSRRDIRCTIL